jgi:hypothetical protein
MTSDSSLWLSLDLPYKPFDLNGSNGLEECRGQRIRELRGFDMTQAELAMQIGVSQGSRLVRGTRGEGNWRGDLAADWSGVWEVAGVVVDGGRMMVESARHSQSAARSTAERDTLGRRR